MKLKNILLAGLAVMCITSSCSKDNDIPSTPGDAKINIKLRASGPGMKADDLEQLTGEANINNVGAAVFNEDGSDLLGTPFWQEMDASGSATVLNIPSTSQKAMIVILTNCPNNVFDGVTTYAGLQGKLAKLTDQSQDNLTMSSQVIKTKEPLVKNDNYLGYTEMGSGNINGIASPLEVTRLAARIDLANVTTTFAGTNLAGRTVRIDRVSMVNEKTASRFFSEDYWGVVMAADNFANSEEVAMSNSLNDGTPITNVIYRHYVMENDGSVSPTQIRIRATLLAAPGYEAETRTFTATVNLNGVLVQGQPHKYVKRNHVYRLSVNFSGTSFMGDPDIPTPPPADPNGKLDVKVEVVGWGPVNQPVEIE